MSPAIAAALISVTTGQPSALHALKEMNHAEHPQEDTGITTRITPSVSTSPSLVLRDLCREIGYCDVPVQLLRSKSTSVMTSICSSAAASIQVMNTSSWPNCSSPSNARSSTSNWATPAIIRSEVSSPRRWR